MLRASLLFFVIALIAAVFGFGGIAASAVEIGKILFWISLALMAVFFVLGMLRRPG